MDIHDLQETAELARLPLSEAELQAAFPAFEEMLGYFEAMRAADDDEVSFGGPLAALAPVRRTVGEEHFRADGDAAGAGEVAADTFLENSGERDDRYIVIPNVL